MAMADRGLHLAIWFFQNQALIYFYPSQLAAEICIMCTQPEASDYKFHIAVSYGLFHDHPGTELPDKAIFPTSIKKL